MVLTRQLVLMRIKSMSDKAFWQRHPNLIGNGLLNFSKVPNQQNKS